MDQLGVSPARILMRGATRRCPVCGTGGLFSGWFNLAKRCPRCELRFEREPGTFIGAIGMNTIVTFVSLFGIILVGALYDLSDREVAMLQNYWLGKRAAILVMLDPNGETPKLHQFLQSKGVAPRPDRVLLAESTSAGPKKQL